MATLQYDLSVVGRRVVESELASLERRFVQHQQRMNRAAAKAMSNAGRSLDVSRASNSRRAEPMFGPGRKEFQAAIKQREKAEIASARLVNRERLSQEKNLASARTSLDRQRSRALYQQHREQEAVTRRAQEARVSFVRSTVGGGVGRVLGTVGAVGRGGVAAAGLGGGALAAAGISQALKSDEIARRLSIAGRGPGEAGVDPKTLQKEFTRTAIATGFAPEEIGAATAAYVSKTGDLDTARRNQQVFATVAQASGGEVTDVFRAAADLSTKLGIKGVEEMSQAFAILSQQGKKGAFELKAMASEFPEVLGSAATAGVRGVEGARDVGAMMQIARDTSGSDSEAATAVNSMFRQLGARSKDIQSGKAFGGRKVSVFEDNDPTKPMRNFTDVLADSIEASRGNVVELQDVFDVRGKKAIDPLITAYQRASNDVLAQGGTKEAAHKAGRSAIESKFGDYRNVSSDVGEVRRDANDAMQAASVQLEVVMTQLKDAMATQLMPTLVTLIPRLAELAPAVASITESLVRAASFLANNPFTGLGALVTGAILLELTKAGIGAAVGAALPKILQGLLASHTGGALSVPGAAGLKGWKGGLATAGALVGVGMTIDAATEFGHQNGGWGGAGAFFGIGTNDFGFSGIDEYLNRQARERAERERDTKVPVPGAEAFKTPMGAEEFSASVQGASPATRGALPGSWDVENPAPILNATDANAQLQLMAQNAAAANAELAKIRGDSVNRSDKPTGMKQ